MKSFSNFLRFFDLESGLKVRYSKVLDTPQGAFTQSADYLDYKEVNEVMFHSMKSNKWGHEKLT